jgi:antitoxin component of RelBE/YafQ-DinJ toxin-antitoxin module
MSKTEHIKVRVTPDEKAEIYLVAERRKITVSELIKQGLKENKAIK